MNLSTRHLVDRLAALDAQLASLKAERDVIADTFKADAVAEGGKAAFEGTEHLVTVVASERESVNWKDVAAKLEPSRQLIVAHTSHSTVVTLKVTGKAKLLRAA